VVRTLRGSNRAGMATSRDACPLVDHGGIHIGQDPGHRRSQIKLLADIHIVHSPEPNSSPVPGQPPNSRTTPVYSRYQHAAHSPVRTVSTSLHVCTVLTAHVVFPHLPHSTAQHPSASAPLSVSVIVSDRPLRPSTTTGAIRRTRSTGV
jgi:hypothetical protein